MAGIVIKSSKLGALSEAFRVYARVNHRDTAELFADQSRKLATELYVQTAAIAPSKSEIASDVKALGWRIPAFFKDGRLGRGLPTMWADFTFDKRAKRGRPKKGQTRDDARAQRPTLAQMQAFVIAMRVKARLFLASGWLGAVADLGGSLKASSGDVDGERGGAILEETADGRFSVTLWNRTPGIETMDAKKNFVAKAIAVRAADMFVYIKRKLREQAEHFRAA